MYYCIFTMERSTFHFFKIMSIFSKTCFPIEKILSRSLKTGWKFSSTQKNPAISIFLNFTSLYGYFTVHQHIIEST